MQDFFETYIQSVSLKFAHPETSEMGYRTDFENLLNKLFESVKNLRIDHDPKAVEGNKPDFAIFSGEVPLLYIEVKDIGVSLDKIEKSDQMNRYFGYANLVLTDYLEFRFYRNGLKYCEPIKVAEYDIKNRSTKPIIENNELLEKTLTDFPRSFKEPIKSGKHLAKIMGGKAQRIRDNIRQFYSLETDKNSDLIRLYETIKKLLVHDLTINTFSDMYAQTLVYGLFVARYYDDSKEDFTRQEARELIPNSNPLLRHFFDHIVGADFDSRLKYVVDELCEVFSHSNVQDLMKEYFKENLWGETQKGPDPVIHFYEDFLKEYDPLLRKKMGAYYTPQPVVSFIVKSVDYLLKKEFGLISGLADISKTKEGLHKVQVLDPATGTGTFISAIIRTIYKSLLDRGQKGAWPSYVHHDLLPRIFGFELMMAPYTIAHLKLGIAFRQTGFWDFHRRLGIYLTNSLEESVVQQDLFSGIGLSESIAEESKEASVIKNEKPIMVVIGNPPYSGESSNKNYTGNNVYKVEPTGGKLKERNPKWLNDDYVKFIRFAESMIEKNGDGIVAMITAHGYIDNPTFRGMRYHLMQTFDRLYILDLHGNSNKKERSPDGSEDKNVFDIKTGVAIFIGYKKKDNKSDLARVYSADLYGKREAKFIYLNNNQINSVKWQELNPVGPNFFFAKKNNENSDEYNKGIRIDELFKINSVGIVTAADSTLINFSEIELLDNLRKILNTNTKNKLSIKFEKHVLDASNIRLISYRPFDDRFIYYSDEILERARVVVMKNMVPSQNYGLSWIRPMSKSYDFDIFISKNVIDQCFAGNKSAGAGISYLGPLYIITADGEKLSNLNVKIVSEIEKVVGKVSPEDIFDYVYAILYSPNYRKKYRELLKIGFPCIPYPKDIKSFKRFADLGSELRHLQFLESSKISQPVTTYPNDGSNIVEKVDYKNGNVYINENQYFGNVSEIAWNFYIGGYQPTQKWLKDRKGRELTNEDIEHYQKIIVALVETDKIQKKIDEVIKI